MTLAIALLTIAFIVLRLTGVIAWSWWWVLAPLWVSFVFFGVIFAVAWVYFRRAQRRSVKRRFEIAHSLWPDSRRVS